MACRGTLWNVHVPGIGTGRECAIENNRFVRGDREMLDSGATPTTPQFGTAIHPIKNGACNRFVLLGSTRFAKL